MIQSCNLVKESIRKKLQLQILIIFILISFCFNLKYNYINFLNKDCQGDTLIKI